MSLASPEMKALKLTDAEVSAFLDDHIPYRLNQLFGFEHFQTHVSRGLSKSTVRLVGPSVMEGSAIAGRQLCIVLGFCWGETELVRPRWQKRDVNLESFGLTLVSIPSIPFQDREVLKKFLFQANKSTAHLTLSEQPMDGWKCLPEAARIIRDLLKVHLYDALEKHLPSW